MKKILNIFIIIFLCFFSGACGYTTKSALPPNLRTIYVESFANKINYTTESQRNIYYPLLEVKVTNKVIDRFLFDGNLRIADEDSADLILQGELLGYDRYVLRYTDDDEVEEYRILVTVRLVLIDPQVEEPLWVENRFGGEAEYFVTGSEAITESAAVDNAVDDLAKRIVERTIENW